MNCKITLHKLIFEDRILVTTSDQISLNGFEFRILTRWQRSRFINISVKTVSKPVGPNPGYCESAFSLVNPRTMVHRLAAKAHSMTSLPCTESNKQYLWIRK